MNTPKPSTSTRKEEEIIMENILINPYMSITNIEDAKDERKNLRRMITILFNRFQKIKQTKVSNIHELLQLHADAISRYNEMQTFRDRIAIWQSKNPKKQFPNQEGDAEYDCKLEEILAYTQNYFDSFQESPQILSEPSPIPPTGTNIEIVTTPTNIQKKELFPNPTPSDYENAMGNLSVTPYDRKEAADIPNFDGNIGEFKRFWDVFNTFVHNTNASDAQKFKVLWNKLDRNSQNIIAGRDSKRYNEIYIDIEKYYTNPIRLQKYSMERIRKLRKVESEKDVLNYQEVSCQILNLYASLTDRMENQSYLQYNFLNEILQKLPEECLDLLINSLKRNPTVEEYCNHLRERVQLMGERFNITEYHSNRTSDPKPQQFKPRPFSPKSGYTPTKRPMCLFCNGPHYSALCRSPIKNEERLKKLQRENRCLVCLSRQHLTKDCLKPFNCRNCYGRHMTSVCIDRVKPSINQIESIPKESTNSNLSSKEDENEPNIFQTLQEKNNSPEKVYKPILVPVKIGKHMVEAIYDTGANVSVISKQLCNQLDLEVIEKKIKFNEVHHQHELIGHTTVNTLIGFIQRPQKFYVLESGTKIIIGLDTIDKFSLAQNTLQEIHQNLSSESIKINTTRSFHYNQTELEIANLTIENEADEKKLQEVIEESSEIFSKSKFDIGKVKDQKCHIELNTKIPINLRPYKCSAIDQQRINEQLEELLNAGLIEKSSSPYSFPIVLVDKKDDGKKTRLCIDYRKLNAITELESYPMPRIIDIEDKLLNANYFTTLDIASGFYHIEVAQNDKHKTAFVTMDEHFQWNVMPFGLRNAPLIFQRIIFNILKRQELTKFSHNYIDDIIVFSSNFDEHIEHLKKIFNALKEENLKLKLSKCHFAQQTVNYLGHKISYNKIEPINSNVNAILKFQTPKDQKSVRTFLGKVNYYHRFIPNRATMLSPLYELTKKNTKFEWNNEAQNAFDSIKTILTTKPALTIFNPEKKTLLKTDASQVGIGAILKQEHGENDWRTVGYFSRKLLPYQNNYAITEKECLAIVEAIEYWHPYLYGREFVIETDHQPLKWIMNHKKPNTRLFNWSMRLNQYKFTVKYVKGKENEEADCLSRFPIELNFTEIKLLTLEKIKEIQKEYLNDFPKGYELHNGFIVKTTRNHQKYFLPKEFALEQLKQIHEVGHRGITTTLNHYTMCYHSPDQNRLAASVINNCKICLQIKKPTTIYGEMNKIGEANKPYDIIHIDTVGGFAGYKSTNRYLHIAIDSFSRYIWTTTSTTQTSRDFVKLVEKIKMDGKPKLIVADKYTGINSKNFKEYLNQEKIKTMFTPTDHPQSNGMIERAQQTIVNKLRCKMLERPGVAWTTNLHQCVKDYNSTIHSSTKFTPEYLLNGVDNMGIYKDHNLIQDRKIAFNNSNKAHQKSKENFDKKHPAMNFKIGDQVYAKQKSKLNRKKLDPIFEGPYEIEKQLSNSMFKIKGRQGSFHISSLKRIMITLITMTCSIMLTTAMNYQVSSPVLWRRSSHDAAKEMIEATLVMQIQNPCYYIKEKSRSNGPPLWCTIKYNQRVIRKLKENCSPRPLNKRPKRFIAAVTVGVSTVIMTFLSVIGLISTHQNTERIVELQADLTKSIQNARKATIMNNLINSKILPALEELKREIGQLANATEFEITQNALLTKFLIIENELRLFFETNHEEKFEHLSYLFPNISICPNCPKEHWHFNGCEFDDSTTEVFNIILHIGAIEVDMNNFILQADPFWILTTKESETCIFHYTGSTYKYYNSKTQCSQDIMYNPLHAYDTMLVYNSPVCHSYSINDKKYFELKGCVKSDEINAEEVVQFKSDKLFMYVYCYTQNITILEGKEQPCPNQIMKIQKGMPIQVNKINFTIHQMNMNMRISIAPNISELLNQRMLLNADSLKTDLRDLRTLVNEQRFATQEDLKHGNTTHTVFILTILGCIILILTIAYITYQCSKSKRKPLQIFTRQTPEVVNLSDRAYRNLIETTNIA